MPWTREKNILRYDLFGDKIIENCTRKILEKINFNNNSQKTQIYRWIHKFQVSGSVEQPAQ